MAIKRERQKSASKVLGRSKKGEHPESDEQANKLAKRDQKAGKSPSTQAGHFVHEEIEHAKKGKHTVRSAKQAVAIGLSKARKYGIPLPSRGKRKKTSVS